MNCDEELIEEESKTTNQPPTCSKPPVWPCNMLGCVMQETILNKFTDFFLVFKENYSSKEIHL